MEKTKEFLLRWFKKFVKIRNEDPTEKEIDVFSELINTYGTDEILNAIVFTRIKFDDPYPGWIVRAISLRTIHTRLEVIWKTISNMDKDEKEEFEKAKKAFIKEVSNFI